MVQSNLKNKYVKLHRVECVFLGARFHVANISSKEAKRHTKVLFSMHDFLIVFPFDVQAQSLKTERFRLLHMEQSGTFQFMTERRLFKICVTAQVLDMYFAIRPSRIHTSAIKASGFYSSLSFLC